MSRIAATIRKRRGRGTLELTRAVVLQVGITRATPTEGSGATRPIIAATCSNRLTRRDYIQPRIDRETGQAGINQAAGGSQAQWRRQERLLSRVRADTRPSGGVERKGGRAMRRLPTRTRT